MLSQIVVTVFDAQTKGTYAALNKTLNSREDFESYKAQYDTFMKHLCGANVFNSPTTAVALDYAVVDEKRQVYITHGNLAYIRLDKTLRNFDESFKRIVSTVWDINKHENENISSGFIKDWKLNQWLRGR